MRKINHQVYLQNCSSLRLNILQYQILICFLIIFKQQSELYMQEESKRRFHYRNTDFFLKTYTTVTTEFPDLEKVKEVVDVQMECLGYGVFDQKKLIDRFFQYTVDLLKLISSSQSQIKTFKITLNGVNLQLASSKQIFSQIAKNIENIQVNLMTLWIHTSNLKNVSLDQFSDLLNLAGKLSHQNFEDFSLQCANWTFLKNQPTFSELQTIFQRLIGQTQHMNRIKNRKFRLQISGWYFDEKKGKKFLSIEEEGEQEGGNKKQRQEKISNQISKFHNKMQQLIKGLLEIMDNIEILEVDMRNYCEFLKLKQLKKKMNNIKKDNRAERSIISKRADIQGDEAEKQFNFIYVI